MKFKMIFLAAICGFALSSLSGMAAAEHEYTSQGYEPVNSHSHGLMLIVKAAEANDQKKINAIYKLHNNRAFIQALKISRGNEIEVPNEFALVTYKFQPGVLDKARAMLKIAEQNK